MVSNRLATPHRYSVSQDVAGELASFDVVNTIVRDIAPEIRRSLSQGIDIAVEMHEYKTTGLEGKYTHGVYSKLEMIRSPETESELDIDDDGLLEVVEWHLSDLNRQVVNLHSQVRSTLAEMRALEGE